MFLIKKIRHNNSVERKDRRNLKEETCRRYLKEERCKYEGEKRDDKLDTKY